MRTRRHLSFAVSARALHASLFFTPHASLVPSNLTKNIVANGFGRLWGVAVNVIFVPVYVRLLGSESYGLVVAYATIVASIQVLDIGLSGMLSRELALRVAEGRSSPESLGAARNLARTVEVVSILVGVLIGATVFSLAPIIADRWLVTQHLSQYNTASAVRLIGLIIAVQWPGIAFQSGLLGLQSQVQLNLIRILTSTVQSFGAAIILWKVSTTINAYFIWLLITQLAGTLLMRRAMWRSLHHQRYLRPQIRWSMLLSTWRFSLGLAGIALLSSALTQSDKIILSKIVPLSEFGTYGIAFTVCNVLSLIAGPVYLAALPQLTAVSSPANGVRLRELYFRSSELVALLVFPAWMILAFHSREIATIWLGKGDRADAVGQLLPLLSVGSLANAMDTMPYGLQIASAWTSLSVTKNVVAVAIVVPALILCVHQFGTIGAAAVWASLNIGYLIFEIPLMHRRLLQHSLASWYFRCMLVPILCTVLVGVLSRYIGVPNDRFIGLAVLLGYASVAALCLAVTLPSVRNSLGLLIYKVVPGTKSKSQS
jgi:O-antigen/teichoic acid export membrane protein